MKRALITGVTGQDGSYLAELLVEKGYEVHGMVRRSSSINRTRIDHIFEDTRDVTPIRKLHYGDLTDASSVNRLLRAIEPDEIYNLGAQSHVKVSFEIPEYTAETAGLGALRLLEGIRETGQHPRFYQAGSSEMFGMVRETPQTETTPFYPRSPYAAAKVYAHAIVTRKITRGVAAIKLGHTDKLALGNLDAKRDWGYAKDYVDAMWTMLQQDTADDYVIATGETHSVREFCEVAFAHAGLDYRKHVVVDQAYFRPTEVDVLLGDASKARDKLRWKPTVSFEGLARMMVDADIAELSR
jgi:GDPmannose 4,6-dehydratase